MALTHSDPELRRFQIEHDLPRVTERQQQARAFTEAKTQQQSAGQKLGR